VFALYENRVPVKLKSTINIMSLPKWLLYTGLIFTALSCSDKKPDTLKSSAPPVAAHATPLARKAHKTFKYVNDYPAIKDSLAFMNELRAVCQLRVHDSPVQAKGQKITAFKKIKLYGSDKDYFLIEYNWAAGDMASYPWQYQVVLSANGIPIKVIAGERFELVEIFSGQKPFLLATIVTSFGNGGHRIYKVTADSLENVYEGYYDYDVRTVDRHEDLDAFEPEELNISFKDYNKDGLNDIIFSGEKLLLYETTPDGLKYDTRVINGKSVPFTPDDPAKRIPVKYIFLYDKTTRHFKAREKYPAY